MLFKINWIGSGFLLSLCQPLHSDVMCNYVRMLCKVLNYNEHKNIVCSCIPWLKKGWKWSQNSHERFPKIAQILFKKIVHITYQTDQLILIVANSVHPWKVAKCLTRKKITFWTLDRLETHMCVRVSFLSYLYCW